MRMQIRHRSPTGAALGVFILLSGLAGPPAPARAGEVDHPAARVITVLGQDVAAVLANDSLGEAEQAAAFRRLLLQRFDTARIADFVLGRYRQRGSDAERAAFRAVFVDYIVATYARRLSRYEGEMPRVEGLVPDDRPGHVTVRSRVRPPSGPAVEVLWRLHEGGEGWRIVDVVVEGVSLGITQRAEFAAFLGANGGRIPALTGALEKKMARLN